MSLSPLLLEAAAAATAGQQHPASTLYVVATPIGNLADLSLRAIHVLSLADAVACEDTRVTAVLLQRLGLHKPLLALHQHNEDDATPAIVARLARGERVAYVSDAGTPAVSDPGARLVAGVHAAGWRVLPLPGASSVVTALSAAGDAQGSGFRFIGFLPPKAQARQRALRALADESASVVIFEAPHRIEALAQALADELGNRTLTVCRELTKQFESIHTLPAAQWPAWLAADADRRRGEFVVVLHGLGQGLPADETEVAAGSAALDAWLQALLDAMPLKQAVSVAATASGVPRNTLYQRALVLRADRVGLTDGADEIGARPETATDSGRASAPGPVVSAGVVLASSQPFLSRRRPFKK
jgi:16S rRNA (cytidine1402-2'-O)-methyltransferase